VSYFSSLAQYLSQENQHFVGTAKTLRSGADSARTAAGLLFAAGL